MLPRGSKEALTQRPVIAETTMPKRIYPPPFFGNPGRSKTADGKKERNKYIHILGSHAVQQN